MAETGAKAIEVGSHFFLFVSAFSSARQRKEDLRTTTGGQRASLLDSRFHRPLGNYSSTCNLISNFAIGVVKVRFTPVVADIDCRCRALKPLRSRRYGSAVRYACISDNDNNDDDSRAGLSRTEIYAHGLVQEEQVGLIVAKSDDG
jgi:hypothetical protein